MIYSNRPKPARFSWRIDISSFRQEGPAFDVLTSLYPIPNNRCYRSLLPASNFRARRCSFCSTFVRSLSSNRAGFFGSFFRSFPLPTFTSTTATQAHPGTFHPGRNPWPAGSCADFSQGRSVNLVHPYFRCQALTPNPALFPFLLPASRRSLSLVRGAEMNIPNSPKTGQ